ncbi:hypothetical protein Tco_0632825 [Tanacetum coccineum]
MAWLLKIAELQEDSGSSDWTDMFVFNYRRSAAEDREFARHANALRGKLVVVCEERVYFVEELESVKRVIAPNLEREAEMRAIEKELFVPKLLRNVPF